MMSYKISVAANNILIEGQPDREIRIGVEKDGNNYYYAMNSSRELLPIQLGAGTYQVKILRRKQGTTFTVILKKTLHIAAVNQSSLWLASTQPVYWDKPLVRQKSATVTQGATSIEQKVEQVYRYVMKIMVYDTNKINTIGTDYVPDLEKLIHNPHGICYDYAALVAGLLRAQGIAAKLVKGYRVGMTPYHAWNEVWVNNRWVIIDATYDDALNTSRKVLPMAKNRNDYKKEREY